MNQDGGPPVALIVPEQEGDNAVIIHNAVNVDDDVDLNVALGEDLDIDDRIERILLFGIPQGPPMVIPSPLLFKMIQEGCTCTSLLSGRLSDRVGCRRIVQICVEQPQLAAYSSSPFSRTPLHEACLRNSCSHVIQALIQANPAGALQEDDAGNIPLHLLFVDNNFGFVQPDEMVVICKDLLQVNPAQMVTTVNQNGDTPLHFACLATENRSHGNIFLKILSANPACAAILNRHLQTPLLLYCKQRHAQIEVATRILLAHPFANHQADSTGKTPLHNACKNLHTDLICFLLQHAPGNARRPTHENMTPAHLLCQGQPRDTHLPALEALLQAAPDALRVTDSDHGRTPLHIACRVQRASLAVIQRLVYANPEAVAMVDGEHYTALHHACENGADAEIIALLLSACPMAASIVTRKQDFAIHIACGANLSTKTVTLLIGTNKKALTMTNDYGFTPLHCVCRAYQPRMGIVQAILEVCPSCVVFKTHGGETPIHLACSSAAFVGVLQLLTLAHKTVTGDATDSCDERQNSTTNKVGNTPLHEACFRGASFDHIETLAKATPEWIVAKNNAGYTPLQVMCKGGLLDKRVVKAFSRIRGQEVFSVMDPSGHTPLHSACRVGTNVAAIRSIIRAFPEALHLKTTYGDNPLHLACFRGAGADVVNEVARASCDGRHKALLERNTAGLSPIGIAMQEFHTVRSKSASICCVTSTYDTAQLRAFDVLATLVKILFYGTSHHEEVSGPASLVKACVCLHRLGVRLDPTFIRRAIHVHPEEVRLKDSDGNYPLHIEANIPVEKMSILDGATKQGCCGGKCHSRTGVLVTLFQAYPEATHVQNKANEFPLGLMMHSGRSWDNTFALVLRNFPPALHWYNGMDDKIISLILSRVSKECGLDTLYEILNSRPDMVRRRL